MESETYAMTGSSLTCQIINNLPINGYNSDLMPVDCGVPQCFVQGPLLFLIYINDLHKAIQYCIMHHFADDTNLFHTSM